MIGRPTFRLKSVLIGVVFGVLVVLTWQRSGDPLIDWGRELYTALSVSEGRGIPLDVLLLFGPVSPLINGTVFRFGGENTVAILSSNLVFLAIALILVYDITKRLFGRRAAFLGSVLFLFLSGFPHLVRVGNYNFLTPYSHGLTHGLVLGLLMLASLFRALESGRAAWWLLAGVSAGLAACTKPEVGLSAVLTLSCGMVLAWRLRPERKKTAFIALAGLVMALTLTATSVSQVSGVSPTVIFEPYRSAVRVASLDFPFYGRSGGLGTILVHGLVGLGTSVALILAILLPGRDPGLDRRETGASTAASFRLRGAAAVAGLFAFLTLRFPFAWLALARALPWVVAATLLTCIWVVVARKGDLSRRQLQRTAELGLLSLFSATLLAKMGLDTHFDHYGFALSAPACLLGLGLLSHDLPAQVRRKRTLTRRARYVAPALTLFIVLSASTQSTAFYSRRTHQVGDGADGMLVFAPDFDPRVATFDRTLHILSNSERFNSGALILPEGSMFHYMLRTPSSLPVASLMPLEMELLGSARVLRMIESDMPQLIVVAEPDLSAWHAVDLPRSSYSEVRSWVESNYCEAGSIGDRNSGEDRLQATFYETCEISGRVQGHGSRPTVLTADRGTHWTAPGSSLFSSRLN